MKAFRAFGSNPKKDGSVVRRAGCEGTGRTEALPAIHPLVDCYNALSVEFGAPFGGEDSNRYAGVPRLAFADGTEASTPRGMRLRIAGHPGRWRGHLARRVLRSPPPLELRQCKRTQSARVANCGSSANATSELLRSDRYPLLRTERRIRRSRVVAIDEADGSRAALRPSGTFAAARPNDGSRLFWVRSERSERLMPREDVSVDPRGWRSSRRGHGSFGPKPRAPRRSAPGSLEIAPRFPLKPAARTSLIHRRSVAYIRSVPDGYEFAVRDGELADLGEVVQVV